MDVIILTGGRGKRLGALTGHRPKATLHFAGKSLFAHTLTALTGTDGRVKQIYVVTGYRSTIVEHTVAKDCVRFARTMLVKVLPQEKKQTGAFKSTLWGLLQANITQGCLVVGIDALVTQKAMRRFLVKAQEKQTMFMVSPRLSVAPTHGHIRLKGDRQIAEYRKCSSRSSTDTTCGGWYADVGIRYLSASFIEECHSLTLKGPCDFDDVMPGFIQRGVGIKAHISAERWLHFGVSKDFGRNPLI